MENNYKNTSYLLYVTISEDTIHTYFHSHADHYYMVQQESQQLTPDQDAFYTIFPDNNQRSLQVAVIEHLSQEEVETLENQGAIREVGAANIAEDFQQFLALHSMQLDAFRIDTDENQLCRIVFSVPDVELDTRIENCACNTLEGTITFDTLPVQCQLQSRVEVIVTAATVSCIVTVHTYFIHDLACTFTLDALPKTNLELAELVKSNTLQWLQQNLLHTSSSAPENFLVLLEQGAQITDPWQILKEHFKLSVAEIATLLKEKSGYSAKETITQLLALTYPLTGIVAALQKGFAYSAEQAISELMQHDFPESELIAAIQSVYACTGSELLDILQHVEYQYATIASIFYSSLGYSISSIALLLHEQQLALKDILAITIDTLHAPVPAVAKLSLALDIPVAQVAAILYTEYEYSLDNLYAILKENNLSMEACLTLFRTELEVQVAELVTFLIAKGYTPQEIVKILSEMLALQEQDIAEHLQAASFTEAEIAMAFAACYYTDQEQLLTILDSVDACVNDIAVILQVYYQCTDKAIATLLLERGKPLAAICGALFKVLDYPLENILAIMSTHTTDPVETAQILFFNVQIAAAKIVTILKQRELIITDIADILKDTLQLSAEEIGIALKDSGSINMEIAKILGVYLKYDQTTVFNVLQKLEVPIDEIAVLIQSAFNSSGEEMAEELYNGGIKAPKIASILLSLYYFPLDRTTKLLLSLTFSVEEVAEAIKTAYTLTAEEVFAMLTSLKIDIVEICKAIKKVYRYSNSELTLVLHNQKVRLKVIVHLLQQEFKCQEVEFILCLRKINLSYRKIISLLRRRYTNKREEIAEHLYQAGVPVNDLIYAMRWHFYFYKFKLVNLLYALGVSAYDITVALKNAYTCSDYVLVKALALALVPARAIAGAVKKVCATTPEKIASLLKRRGFTVEEILQVLYEVYTVEAETAVKIIKKIRLAQKPLQIDHMSTALTYTYACSDQEFASLLRSITIHEIYIAKNLKNLYSSSATDMTRLLLVTGSKPVPITRALADVFQLIDEKLQEIVTVLYQNHVSATDIALAAKKVVHMKPYSFVLGAQDNDIPVIEVATALAKGYKCNIKTVIRILFELGYSPDLIALVLIEKYGYSNETTAKRLQQVGATYQQVVFALKAVSQLSDDQIIAVLKKLQCPYEKIAGFILWSSNPEPGAMVEKLHALGFTVKEIATCLALLYELTEEEIITILVQSNIEPGRVAELMIKVFHKKRSELVTVFSKAGVALAVIVTILKTTFHCSYAALAAVLNEAGVSVLQIVFMLHSYYNTSAYHVVRLLKGLQKDKTEIRNALKEIYQLSDTEIDRLLRSFYG